MDNFRSNFESNSVKFVNNCTTYETESPSVCPLVFVNLYSAQFFLIIKSKKNQVAILAGKSFVEKCCLVHKYESKQFSYIKLGPKSMSDEYTSDTI